MSTPRSFGSCEFSIFVIFLVKSETLDIQSGRAKHSKSTSYNNYINSEVLFQFWQEEDLTWEYESILVTLLTCVSRLICRFLDDVTAVSVKWRRLATNVLADGLTRRRTNTDDGAARHVADTADILRPVDRMSYLLFVAISPVNCGGSHRRGSGHCRCGRSEVGARLKTFVRLHQTSVTTSNWANADRA